MVSGQWSVVSGQWSVVLLAVFYKKQVTTCLITDDDYFIMKNGESCKGQRTTDDKWQASVKSPASSDCFSVFFGDGGNPSPSGEEKFILSLLCDVID